MYSIRTLDFTVVGTMFDILKLANILERNKINFKVADVAGFIATQKSMGCGDFNYWMGEDDKF